MIEDVSEPSMLGRPNPSQAASHARSPLALLHRISRPSTTLILVSIVTLPLFYLAWRSYEVDFRAFYVASTAIAHHLDPYVDNHALGPQFADPANQSGLSRWLYPPAGLFFVAPLSHLSYTTARLLFDAVSLASLVWVLVSLSAHFGVRDRWSILAYLSIPVVACVERGQVDLLLLFCLVASYFGGRRLWAGIPLGVAVSLKIFPAALVLWLMLQRRFREAATAILCVLAIGLLSAWRFGITSYLECFQSLTAAVPHGIRDGPVDLIHRFGIPNIDGRWFSISQGFVGSYNNPLVLLDNWGIAAGVALVVLAAVFLHYRRVAPEVGFFTMVMVAQLMNTRLWSMGLVMYLPICLIAISRVRSTWMSLALLIPLYLPSQVRVLGVSPRFVLAILLIGCMIWRGLGRERSELAGDGEQTLQREIAHHGIATAS